MSLDPSPFDAPRPERPVGAGFPPDEPVSPAEPGATITITEMPAYRPVVTYTILGFTVLIWFLQIATKNGFGFDLYRQVGYYGPITQPLDFVALLGMKMNELIRAGEVWRLFTPMFLHDDHLPIHLLTNMYFLAIVGSRVEHYFGHARYTALYVISAFAGNTFSFFFSPNPALGASTALFGLLAAEGVFIYHNQSWIPEWKKALGNVGTTIAINIFLGFGIGADNWGHIGGFVGGAMFCWFAGPVLRLERYALDLARVVDVRSSRAVVTTALLVFALFCLMAAAGFVWGVTGLEAQL